MSLVRVACALLSLLLLGAADPRPVPRLTELATGPYARMHMLLEKTVLRIDVAEIEVAVDSATRDRLSAAAVGRAHSPELEAELAAIALSTKEAVIEMKFLRRVSLMQWIDGVRDSIAQAKAAGLVDAALAKRVSDGLPRWFSAAERGGFAVGDSVLYRISPDGLRTVIVRKGGTVVVDRTDPGRDKCDLVLATYFAPGTPYRTPLLRSLR